MTNPAAAGFGFGVVLLINCGICGYLLINTSFLQKRLPLTYGTSDYFRILLFGYTWLMLWYALLSIFPQPVSYLAEVFNQDINETKPFAVSAVAIISAIIIRILDDLLVSRPTAEQILAGSDRKMERTCCQAARDGNLVRIDLKEKSIIGEPLMDTSRIARNRPEELSVLAMITISTSKDSKDGYTIRHHRRDKNLSPKEREKYEVTIAIKKIETIEAIDLKALIDFQTTETEEPATKPEEEDRPR